MLPRPWPVDRISWNEDDIRNESDGKSWKISYHDEKRHWKITLTATSLVNWSPRKALILQFRRTLIDVRLFGAGRPRSRIFQPSRIHCDQLQTKILFLSCSLYHGIPYAWFLERGEEYVWFICLVVVFSFLFIITRFCVLHICIFHYKRCIPIVRWFRQKYRYATVRHSHAILHFFFF